MSLSQPVSPPVPELAPHLRATVERLREQIRKVHAAPREYLFSLRTGVDALDSLGAFRLGGAIELSGELASGRTSVALSVVARCTQERRLAAWVDGPKELYPPAAAGLGVELAHLLLVRPKAPGQLIWSAVQLLRSGAFACVVLDLSRTGVRVGSREAKKLLDAARASGSLLVLLTAIEQKAEGLARLVLTPEVAAAPVRRLVGGAAASGESPESEEVIDPIGVTAARRTGAPLHLVFDRVRLHPRPPHRLRRCVRPRDDTPKPGLVHVDPMAKAKQYFYRNGLVSGATRDQPPPEEAIRAAESKDVHRHGEGQMVCGIRAGRLGRDGARPSLHASLERLTNVPIGRGGR